MPLRNQRFLSDPSPIIGYACHSLTHSLTHWLTHCRLVNLIDVTLVCEDANSKLIEVVAVADVENNICFMYLRSLWKGYLVLIVYLILRGQRKQGGELNICFVYLSLWGRLTWYSLCIWGANDEEEGEEERRKVTVDHGPRSADRAPAGNCGVR